MKHLKILTIVLLSISSMNLKAQTKKNSLAFGFNINQVQNDFGIGLELISPYFIKSSIAVKIGGSLKFLEHIDSLETTWTPYQNVQIGIRGRQAIIEDKLFIYGEGGSILLVPNKEFSTQSTVFGGYGLFGFEFKASDNFAFYLELGGVGTGARADKVANKPIYSNGFLTQVGFRITL